MKFLLFLVPIIDVPLKMRFRTKTLAALGVRAFVFLVVVTLVVPTWSY